MIEGIGIGHNEESKEVSPMTSGVIEKSWETEFTKDDKTNKIYHFKLVGDLKEFSSFNPLLDNADKGDTIYFKYVKKGKYYNIHSIYKVEKTGLTPTKEEIKSVKQPYQKDSEIDTNLAILMKCAVDLSIQRKDLSDKSIETTFERLIELIKLKGDKK